MKKWPWRVILLSIALLLILVGIAPVAYLFLFGITHNLEPLSAPISLNRSQYTSPFFTTDLDDTYQADIYFLPRNIKVLDLDWKIVDDSGRVVRQGACVNHGPFGNTVNLVRYPSKRGLRQRIFLDIHQDSLAAGDQAGTDTRLHIGVPERVLEQAYGFAAAIVWAAAAGGTGTLILLVLVVVRVTRPKAPL